MIQLIPVAGLGEIRATSGLEDQLADALTATGISDGDVLVITSKIVSKAEGRFVELGTIIPGARALDLAGNTGKDPRLVELILRESASVVRAAGPVLITRHRLGLVMANAGIDASNLGPAGDDRVLLLPEDPDRSARHLAKALSSRLGCELGIVLSDSFGRPWRQGVVNVAIGVSGVPPLDDRRGDHDRDGRPLRVTQIAYGDLLASAAGLVMGEADEGIPVVVVRGAKVSDTTQGAASLIRPLKEDLFQ
jgi:coenzyme F420-0:L-glutamate ligase / coenzyme F420-1:gamma-L-glutamate ligase